MEIRLVFLECVGGNGAGKANYKGLECHEETFRQPAGVLVVGAEVPSNAMGQRYMGNRPNMSLISAK